MTAPAVELDGALVCQLAAGLGVERGAVHQHLDLRRSRCQRRRHTVHQQPDHPAAGLHLEVAEELGLSAQILGQGLVDGRVGVAGLFGPGVGPRPLALVGHQGAEGVRVHGQALLGGDLQRQVHREAVGVVEGEGLLPRQPRLLGGLGLGGRGVEVDRAALEGAQERVLLGVGGGGDPVPVRLQFGIRGRHGVFGDRQQVGQGGAVHAQ